MPLGSVRILPSRKVTMAHPIIDKEKVSGGTAEFGWPLNREIHDKPGSRTQKDKPEDPGGGI